jgi:hypothetical protein
MLLALPKIRGLSVLTYTAKKMKDKKKSNFSFIQILNVYKQPRKSDKATNMEHNQRYYWRTLIAAHCVIIDHRFTFTCTYSHKSYWISSWFIKCGSISVIRVLILCMGGLLCFATDLIPFCNNE